MTCSAIRNRMQLRKATAFGCSFGLLLTTFGSIAMAGDNTTSYTPVVEGSTPTHRSTVDANGGQTYIYLGGSFPAGTYPHAFQYLFDFAGSNGNTTGYITPLLFARVPSELYTVYVVAGIGEGFQVAINPLPQTIPFKIVEGIKVTPNSEYTFGFVFALVNASGEQMAASSGVMDMDLSPDSGVGVGGPKTTNDWAGTSIAPNPTVALGTTFGEEGAPTNYHFLTCCGPIRTYSAQAIGAVPAQ